MVTVPRDETSGSHHQKSLVLAAVTADISGRWSSSFNSKAILCEPR
jgi:hypothetical protein